MSDFDSAVEKATSLFGEMSQHDHDLAAIFYGAAIASMQGEATDEFKRDLWLASDLLRCRRTDKKLADRLVGYYCTFRALPSAASKLVEQDARIKELEEQLEEANQRLDFMIKETCWIQSTKTDAGGVAYQLWTQNEDEEFYTLHTATEFFTTPRAAIDAAIRQIGGAE